ncbi:MAG: tetratricopeptide repeat protein [Planctomycetes bacterium]|nr:tetratricopeptide repeat protein [Planctomycetota bacterium]
MNALPTLVVAVAVSAAVSAAITLGLRPMDEPGPSLPGDDTRVAELQQRVDDLTEVCRQLRVGSTTADGPVRRAVDGVADDALDAAVARWMSSHPAANGRETAPEFEPAGALQRLATATDEERKEIWVAARDAGKLEELVDLFRVAAEENPNDADAQVGYADALMQRIWQDEDISARERGKVAVLADQTFDRALELNPDHWNARYQKAVSLTFWPSFLGKEPEAVRQFETLLERQSRGPVQPEHANTFFFLGNLYAKRGDRDKAIATWSQGAQMFPDDARLRERLGPR